DRRNGDADFSQVRRRKTRGEPTPGVATVGGFVESAAWTRAGDAPRRPQHFPRGGVEHLWIRRVHSDVGGASPIVDEEHALPRRSAIFRSEHTAFLIGAVWMSDRRNVDDVRVRRMNAHAPDLAAVWKSHVLPRPARIDRLVDPIS